MEGLLGALWLPLLRRMRHSISEMGLGSGIFAVGAIGVRHVWGHRPCVVETHEDHKPRIPPLTRASLKRFCRHSQERLHLSTRGLRRTFWMSACRESLGVGVCCPCVYTGTRGDVCVLAR